MQAAAVCLPARARHGECCRSALAHVTARTLEAEPARSQVELAPIQRLLPDEMLLHVFEKLPIAALGAAQVRRGPLV